MSVRLLGTKHFGVLSPSVDISCGCDLEYMLFRICCLFLPDPSFWKGFSVICIVRVRPGYCWYNPIRPILNQAQEIRLNANFGYHSNHLDARSKLLQDKLDYDIGFSGG